MKFTEKMPNRNESQENYFHFLVKVVRIRLHIIVTCSKNIFSRSVHVKPNKNFTRIHSQCTQFLWNNNYSCRQREKLNPTTIWNLLDATTQKKTKSTFLAFIDFSTLDDTSTFFTLQLGMSLWKIWKSFKRIISQDSADHECVYEEWVEEGERMRIFI